MPRPRDTIDRARRCARGTGTVPTAVAAPPAVPAPAGGSDLGTVSPPVQAVRDRGSGPAAPTERETESRDVTTAVPVAGGDPHAE